MSHLCNMHAKKPFLRKLLQLDDFWGLVLDMEEMASMCPGSLGRRKRSGGRIYICSYAHHGGHVNDLFRRFDAHYIFITGYFPVVVSRELIT